MRNSLLIPSSLSDDPGSGLAGVFIVVVGVLSLRDLLNRVSQKFTDEFRAARTTLPKLELPLSN